jgi:catechol 2,3-dioxygenase-like lactoylglutathione lyase family enzyme
MLTRVDYVMVNVSDMSRSVSFYRDTLGLALHLAPADVDQTVAQSALTTFAYTKSSYPGPAGGARLFKWLLRRKLEGVGGQIDLVQGDGSVGSRIVGREERLAVGGHGQVPRTQFRADPIVGQVRRLPTRRCGPESAGAAARGDKSPAADPYSR